MNLVDILIPKVTPTKLLENIEQKNLKLYENILHAAQDSIPGFMKGIEDHFKDTAQKYDLSTVDVLKHAFNAKPHVPYSKDKTK